MLDLNYFLNCIRFNIPCNNCLILAAVGEDVGDAPPPIPVRISKRSSRTETVLPVPEEMDGSPPVTSSAVPLSECGWYWQNLSK